MNLKQCKGMKSILPAVIMFTAISVNAQSFHVSGMPDSLRNHARVVVRESETIWEVKSPGKAILKEHSVYTILNSNGDNLGGYRTYYDKFTQISSVSGALYDSLGKTVRKVKRKDMEDKSAFDGFSLMEDSRYLDHNFYCRTYPYTVEYQEEDDVNGVLHFEDWMPLISPGISTEHSKFVIIAPKDYEVRYRLLNGAQAPVITEAGDKRVYTWEVRNLPARTTEVSGPRWAELVPVVLAAPSDFEAQGYKGNMSTWENYGRFIEQLRDGRDQLPDETKRQVHALTDTLHDARQKVYALYRYMQQNTHYISVQLGIGGWQPFPAEYVATRKYGDCKALSNFMIALLKEAGITGKYVEIEATEGAAPLIEDFPCSQFNHVVCCVPMDKDTIWLECTSQTESPGYMGSFTGGRKALLIDEQGGHVVQTPAYSSSDNTQCRIVNAQISPEGDLDATIRTLYSGLRQEHPHDLIHYMSAEDREKSLNELFHLPTYKVDKSHYEEKPGKIPAVNEDLHLIAPNYASVSGRRLFVNPNLFDRSRTRLADDTARMQPFIRRRSFLEVDSIQIKLPQGYEPEALPKDMTIRNKFGSYSSSFRFSGDKLIYYRRFNEDAASFAPSDYPALVRYYDQLYQADNARVVLVKKSS
jgi:hypothetical protein